MSEPKLLGHCRVTITNMPVRCRAKVSDVDIPFGESRLVPVYEDKGSDFELLVEGDVIWSEPLSLNVNDSVVIQVAPRRAESSPVSSGGEVCPWNQTPLLAAVIAPLGRDSGAKSTGRSKARSWRQLRRNHGAIVPQTIHEYVNSMSTFLPGFFKMGSEVVEDEQPIRRIGMLPFRLARIPVTVRLWRQYCWDCGVLMPQTPPWGWIDDHPMVNVSWIDICGKSGDGGFVRWATRCTGTNVRLPTEAEWEYAASRDRLGSQFPWGDDFHSENVWVSTFHSRSGTNCSLRWDNVYATQSGLVDMVGNVMQWCADWYGSYEQGSPILVNPEGPPKGKGHVLRGAGWDAVYESMARVTSRKWALSDERLSNTGFRLAR